ncbi:MAG TPA: galactokinase [Acidimicrobiales bacterium]|nr:galactokinase [Acidimicrobiales bacterium]
MVVLSLDSSRVPDIRVRAHAPGRVNIIGDHTDYTGGLVLPMAIDLGTTVELDVGGDVVTLTSEAEADLARVPLDVEEPSSISPAWARYVAGVVAELRPAQGGTGTVRTTIPLGAGLSSSAALEVAVALALGFTGSPLELAECCQRAEQRASGVPCGIMDQLASAAGVDGHALLIDCRSLVVTPVLLPEDVAVVAVHSGQSRTLAGSAYADRRAGCEAAAHAIGPLRDAKLDDVARLVDGEQRRLARHVVTENGRVAAFAEALGRGDVDGAGALMYESHASLRDDFAVSTPVLDQLVERLRRVPGVHGARLTGGGFGGAVVALCERGVTIPGGMPLRPSAGAAVRRDVRA